MATKQRFDLCTAVKTGQTCERRDDGKHTLDTVPFSSTSRGALLLTGGGSGWSRHRQQNRLEKRPLLRGFLVDTEGEEPAGDEVRVQLQKQDELDKVISLCKGKRSVMIPV